jgi:HSP20 family protein
MWRDLGRYNLDLDGGIFEEIDKEFAKVEEMLNSVFEMTRAKPESANGPYFYGYQITVGPNNKPQIKEFGNVKSAPKGRVEQSSLREPLVDATVDENENRLAITAEMPGVTKQNIKVKVSKNRVVINAQKGDKKYHTEIPSNSALDGKSAKATYANGILELKVRMKEQAKPKATEVRVE